MKKFASQFFSVAASVLGVAALFFGLVKFLEPASKPNDLYANSVMIVNRALNHGGTGVIIKSAKSESVILTNDHVCKAVSNGGVVLTETQRFQIASILESEVSDLCFVTVLDDLKTNTSIANKAPVAYRKEYVSGHPHLMPNVISEGHYSGRSIIQVMTGIKHCTDSDLNSDNALVCMFFGGIPIIKAYESVLVTSTIMPGSSGSGVYNESKELTGLVFAGDTEFGYAWTVPYEQLVNFVTKEHKHLRKVYLNQEVNVLNGPDDSKHIKEMLQKCQTTFPTSDAIENYCQILRRDQTWTK